MGPSRFFAATVANVVLFGPGWYRHYLIPFNALRQRCLNERLFDLITTSIYFEISQLRWNMEIFMHRKLLFRYGGYWYHLAVSHCSVPHFPSTMVIYVYLCIIS